MPPGLYEGEYCKVIMLSQEAALRLSQEFFNDSPSATVPNFYFPMTHGRHSEMEVKGPCGALLMDNQDLLVFETVGYLKGHPVMP